MPFGKTRPAGVVQHVLIEGLRFLLVAGGGDPRAKRMKHVAHLRETEIARRSADCLRGSGFTVAPQPVWREASGVQWTRFIATRGEKRLRVRERISDSVGNGWTDVSAWYWNALLKKTCSPWLAVTIVETE